MTNVDTKNFIEEFCKEILEELQISENDPKYAGLLKMIGQRVDSRVFLETVAMLSPEQAALVKADMEASNPEPEQILTNIVSQIPNFQLKLVQVLANLKSELLLDLRKK